MKRGFGAGRILYLVFGFIFLTVGFFYIANSLFGLTGFAVIEDIDRPASGFIGFGFTFVGIFLLSLARRRRRGQAAMEFLMTYGWAILAAIIVIGVLALYFRPGSLMSDSAIVSAPFYAVSSAVTTNGIDIELKNNGGVNVDVERIDISGCDSYSVPYSMSAGGTNVFSVLCTLDEGDRFNGEVTVSYKRGGSSLTLTSKGTISGRVRAGSGAVCSPPDCDDGNECTIDSCNLGICSNDDVSDGTSCTGGQCVNGECNYYVEIVIVDYGCASTISSIPSGMSCAPDLCSGFFPAGELSLTPNLVPVCQIYWDGETCGASSDNPCVVSITNSDLYGVANFVSE